MHSRIRYVEIPTQNYEIDRYSYPVVGYVDIVTGDPDLPMLNSVPLVDIPMMSDYRWQLGALQSRLEHPELYEGKEDVSATIEHLRQWLKEHEGEVDA